MPLGSADAMATVAVKDIQRARRFYEEVLGLKPTFEEGRHAVGYASGRTTVLVYVSEFAGTNKATVATWNVTFDLDGLVRELREKGAVFEHYDLPNTKREGDVHVSGKRRVAWLKDPDGNILALANG